MSKPVPSELPSSTTYHSVFCDVSQMRKISGQSALPSPSAEKRGVPRAQIALAWMLSKSVISAPIVGASKPHHLEDAVAALSVTLTPDEIKTLEEPYVPHPVAGFS